MTFLTGRPARHSPVGPPAGCGHVVLGSSWQGHAVGWTQCGLDPRDFGPSPVLLADAGHLNPSFPNSTVAKGIWDLTGGSETCPLPMPWCTGQRPIRAVAGIPTGHFLREGGSHFLPNCGREWRRSWTCFIRTYDSPWWDPGVHPQTHLAFWAGPGGQQPRELPEAFVPQWESSPARGRVGTRRLVGSVQLWASSGHCLVTHSPGSQRGKPGETPGSQGPEVVSRERWEAIVVPFSLPVLAMDTLPSTRPAPLCPAPQEPPLSTATILWPQWWSCRPGCPRAQSPVPLPGSLLSSPAHPSLPSIPLWFPFTETICVCGD